MPGTTSPDNRPTILIVDDEPFMRTTFQDALNEGGFVTTTAPDGTAAVAEFAKHRPDLVLLDLVMPEKDGFATCLELRAIPGGEYTPILMVTGLDDTESIRRAFDAGATDFISKPINPELLVHRARYMLRASRSLKNLAESEARLASAQQIAHLGNWELYPPTGAFWMSEEMRRIVGIEQGVEPCSLLNLLCDVHPQDREMVNDIFITACREKAPCASEFRIQRPNGTVRLVCLQGQPHMTAAGKIDRLVGTLQDITELRQVEDRLKMLKEAVDCLPIGITLIDTAGKIIYSNPAEAEMHGYAVDELIGREARQFAPENFGKPLSKEKFKSIELWKRESVNIRKDGSEFPVQLSSIAVKDATGRHLGMVTACEDITHRKEIESRMSHLAYYDALTGLPNRGMFQDRLHHALAMAYREKRKVGLLFVDLDNFKDINDSKGHDFGDKLLQEVAQRLGTIMRESDTLARLGGDEFVMVLNLVNDQETEAAAAQRILSIFSQPFTVEGQPVYCNASIGVALYPDDGTDVEGLLKCADTAMYHAKEMGKAQYRFFSAEMNQRIMHRVALEQSLRQGMENQEFFLHYQPKWDVKTSAIVGVEVLLRWQSSDFGLMLPSDFISLTENSGLIFSLGEWVLRTACIQAKEWASAGYQGLIVAVNISGQQFRQSDFLEMVERTIRETGIAPGLLELEFTESVIMEKAEKTIGTLSALKKMGVQLSIDDFGTGYSSLSYLKHFAIDRIKIDRSFVADVNRSNDDAAIVEAIISLAHSLNLRVVAEGVENREQLSYLTERGCDEVQGFYLARPMSAEDVTESLGPRRNNGNGYPLYLWHNNRPIAME